MRRAAFKVYLDEARVPATTPHVDLWRRLRFAWSVLFHPAAYMLSDHLESWGKQDE